MLFKLCCFLILLSPFFPILWINLQSIKSSQALPRSLPNITRLTGRTWLGSLTVQLALWSCLLLLSCTHNILSLRKSASGHLSPPCGKGPLAPATFPGLVRHLFALLLGLQLQHAYALPAKLLVLFQMRTLKSHHGFSRLQ